MTVNAITDTKKGRTGIAPTYLHTTHPIRHTYESIAKCEKQSCDERRRASSTPRRPLFAQEDDEVFVTGSTLYTLETKAGQPPLVITPVSSAVGHRSNGAGTYSADTAKAVPLFQVVRLSM